MKKILIAVDGSTAGLHASRKALELARALEASATLVYVQAPTLVYGAGSLGVSNEIESLQRDAGEKLLRDALADLEPSLPIPSTVLLQGAPAETISDWALKEGFDLVAVGNTGRGAVSRVLLGSVADRLVHICKLPVLVIR